MTSHLMYSQNYYSPVYFAPPPHHQSVYYPPSSNAQPIGKRKTLQLKGSQKKEGLKNHNAFSILSYNILADTYANPGQHRFCPIEYLSWNWRRNLLNKEIKQYCPDFLCLQEVDRIDDLVNDFSDFDKVTYAHAYAKRPGARPDGCATFYNSNRFELLDKKVIIYNDLANEMSLQYIPQVDVRYRRNNIALITLFRLKPQKAQKNGQHNNNMVVGFHNKEDSPLGMKYTSKNYAANTGDEKYLCVVNTHLHWSPSHPDVKLCQTDFLLKAVSSFVAEAKVKLRKSTQKATARNGVKGPATTSKQKTTSSGTVGGKVVTEPTNLKTDSKAKPISAASASVEMEEDIKIAVVISGDFNSLPDSEVYQYISQGELHSRTSYLEGWTFKHNLPLSSCYSVLQEPMTNITSGFVDCIDYIWYDKKQLEIVGLLSPEYEGEVSSEYMKILPNQWFPSDHICLMSHIAFK